MHHCLIALTFQKTLVTGLNFAIKNRHALSTSARTVEERKVIGLSSLLQHYRRVLQVKGIPFKFPTTTIQIAHACAVLLPPTDWLRRPDKLLLFTLTVNLVQNAKHSSAHLKIERLSKMTSLHTKCVCGALLLLVTILDISNAITGEFIHF